MVWRGIDVSNHQGTIDWDRVAGHVDFVVAKASQGISYADPFYRRNRQECARVGIPFGAYHWLEPAEMYGAPDEVPRQVQWFKACVAGTDPPDLLGTLDIEHTAPGGGRRVGAPSPNDCATAIDVYEQELGHTPIAYGGQPVLQPCARVRPEITRCMFWKAYYPGANNGNPAVKAGGYGRIDPWTSLTMWQWTSRGAMPGIGSSGLDLDDLFVPVSSIRIDGGGSDDPGVGEETEMGLCIPLWSQSVDEAGQLWQCYTWDGTWFRAWYGAPIAGDFGQRRNPMGLPCEEIDATGWKAGHSGSWGPSMVPGGHRVVVYRDDGAPLMFPTGMEDPHPTAPTPMPSPEEVAAKIAPLLRASTSITAA